MKMTRQDLKSIVKECLVEILSEGLVESTRSINESRQQQAPVRREAQQTRQAPAPMRPTTADKISFLPARQEIATQQAQQARPRQSIAAGLTSDPILAEMFADTERNGGHLKINESPSAPHKVSYEQMISTAGDAASKKMLVSEPADVFGEASNKWAALAFAEKGPAGSRAV